MLPGLVESSSDGLLLRDESESPRRRSDSDVKKSEDAKIDLEWVGVAGGVMEPLACSFGVCGVSIVLDRVRLGESGGVIVLRKAGLGTPSGTASRYPPLVTGLM